jgi:hypothetical protein
VITRLLVAAGWIWLKKFTGDVCLQNLDKSRDCSTSGKCGTTRDNTTSKHIERENIEKWNKQAF